MSLPAYIPSAPIQTRLAVLRQLVNAGKAVRK